MNQPINNISKRLIKEELIKTIKNNEGDWKTDTIDCGVCKVYVCGTTERTYDCVGRDYANYIEGDYFPESIKVDINYIDVDTDDDMLYDWMEDFVQKIYEDNIADIEIDFLRNG